MKERVDVNQDGPSLIVEVPPPPPGLQIAKDVAVFTYEKLIIYCFSLLQSTYVSSVMRSSWHFSTSGFNIQFPRTP